MKRVLVTSALPYVNNFPHLGNLVCVVSADVYSRYLKLKGIETIYVLGTDEHGTTTETRALKEGLTPKQVCDKYAKIHKGIYDWFECTPDCWGRSSSKENHELTRDIFLKLMGNGYIFEKELEQAYCPKCRRFLSDRYIVGECPHCGYKHARGDQCEKCGKLLEPEELINPKCEVCGSRPVFKKTKHLFIDLPKIEPRLRSWIKKNEAKWSTNARTMTQAWLREGLKPRCITRDLKWGIPVPYRGYENKVFYSWFDAPIAYIGITKENRNDWKDWWLNPSDVELVQFMGKDNIPFHTILFPASLIGTGDNYTLLSRISVNEYLNYEGGMFSKSKHVGVFGDDAIRTGIPADGFRYYLMVNRPEKQDTEFSWEDFRDKFNHELVGNLGNLVYRTLSFIDRFYKGVVPQPGKLPKGFVGNTKAYAKRIDKLLGSLQLKKALKAIMELSKLGNKFFQETEPWKAINEAPEQAATSLYLLVNLVSDLAILIAPYLPATSATLLRQLGFTEASISRVRWEDIGRLNIAPGQKISKPSLLFSKIVEERLEQLKREFSGGDIVHPLSRLELKVAEVLEVKDHPEADKLYILKVSMGNEVRQLVAGLRDRLSKDKLLGKHIVVVANLEKAVLRGKESNGMLLAAIKHNRLRLLEAPKSKPGALVYASGIKHRSSRISLKRFKEARLFVKGKRVFSMGTGPLRTDEEVLEVEMPDGASVE